MSINKQSKRLLSIYFTAGYPTLHSTQSIVKKLQESGADFLEVGFPYSDPVADGPTIQHSSKVSLDNGMTLDVLFNQLKEMRDTVNIPIYLMGYFNPVLQYGVENFCKKCKEVGVKGTIIPDLPIYEYEEIYQDLFIKYEIRNVFIITPQTSESRIRKIDNLSRSFIYLLSSNSTTGTVLSIKSETEDYLKRIQKLDLKSPLIIGFGISDRSTFNKATNYTNGAIVGSAFVKLLGQENYIEKISDFISDFKRE